MALLEELTEGQSYLYKDNYFSGNYNQKLLIKKSIDDGSHKPKYYIGAYTNINGKLIQQGYIYFYLNYIEKTSSFIGIGIDYNYRDINIGSLLLASWIELCLDNGYNFLDVNKKQKKPFLIHLLKKYGFEILDKSLYDTRSDVITICDSQENQKKDKLLLFKNQSHENRFKETNVYKTDNYKIIKYDEKGLIRLDRVIIPLQDIKKSPVDYKLLNYDKAEEKVKKVIIGHKK